MSERNLKTAITQLLEQKHLLSVQEILEHFESKGHRYNKTSVYRALDQLSDQGTVCRHHLSNEEAKYELREHHHSHLVCTNCGRVTSTDCTLHTPPNYGDFKVDHHHTTIFGLCGNCQ